jgi:hypothetical protein
MGCGRVLEDADFSTEVEFGQNAQGGNYALGRFVDANDRVRAHMFVNEQCPVLQTNMHTNAVTFADLMLWIGSSK